MTRGFVKKKSLSRPCTLKHGIIIQKYLSKKLDGLCIHLFQKPQQKFTSPKPMNIREAAKN